MYFNYLKVDFPYLVLLISGGHCLIAIVENVTTFRLLGHSIDTAPGEAFDKVKFLCKIHVYNIHMYL